MKVISGGQIGADIAGLRAAKRAGLETGGWMTFGYQTLDGPKPEYHDMYGIIDIGSTKYSLRTRYNVRDSDLTIRFAYNFDSPGERCTLKAIQDYNKPHYDVRLELNPLRVDGWHSGFVVSLLSEEKINTVNIAGNASSMIEDFVEQFLLDCFHAAQLLRKTTQTPLDKSPTGA